MKLGMNIVFGTVDRDPNHGKYSGLTWAAKVNTHKLIWNKKQPIG